MLERHRIAWTFLKHHTNLFDGSPKKMLHLAPEPEIAALIKKNSQIDYLSADLNNPRAMVKMDITNILYDDQTFDVIYCSHVLEHVPDDIKALKELFRVLKDNGWALIMVPVMNEYTFEDSSITNAEERERVFGQSDHVRRYGPDFLDRLKEAGFTVKKNLLNDLLSEEQIKRYALDYIKPQENPIYLCTKQQ